MPGIRTLKRGDVGEDVAELQRLLTRAGHAVPDVGRFGPITDHALREYQSEHGLVVDGVAGLRTMTSLRGEMPPSDPPPQAEIWGVDVSEFNSPDVPALAAAGCSFAILRGMTGSDSTGKMRADAKVHSHYRAFTDAGIEVVGIYGWVVSSRTGVEQARLLRATVKDYSGWLAPDHEPSKVRFVDPAQATGATVGFVREVESDGSKAVVYTGPWAVAQAPLLALGHCPLWLSNFAPSWPTKVPAPWMSIALWQCGFVDPDAPDNRKIDKNIFRGTLDGLRALGR
jgi:GH25 family lysozyme M1 (1,4-beta-N-acetylmuramidase)